MDLDNEGQVSENNENSIDSPPSTADRIAADNQVKREAITRVYEPKEEVKEEKPAGYLPIDPETASPKEVKERLDYIYKQMKENEKAYKSTDRTLAEYRTIAQQQADKINELMSGFGVVVDHLHNKTTEENESTVRAQMQSAFEAGDTAAYLAAQEKLMDIKVQKNKEQKPQNKNETQQMAHAGVKMGDANKIAQDAVSDGEFSQDDAAHVAAWQDETDQSGQPLRPWAKTPDPNDPDPDYVKALLIAKKVWQQNPNMTAEQKLTEVDRRMGVQSRSGGQTVMGGNLTGRPNKQKISLSPELQKLAVRTKFGGSKAKTDADHIEAYRKQIEKVQSSKRSR